MMTKRTLWNLSRRNCNSVLILDECIYDEACKCQCRSEDLEEVDMIGNEAVEVLRHCIEIQTPQAEIVEIK